MTVRICCPTGIFLLCERRFLSSKDSSSDSTRAKSVSSSCLSSFLNMFLNLALFCAPAGAPFTTVSSLIAADSFLELTSCMAGSFSTVSLANSPDPVGDVGVACGAVSACFGGPNSFSVCLLSRRRCSSIAGAT